MPKAECKKTSTFVVVVWRGIGLTGYGHDMTVTTDAVDVYVTWRDILGMS